MIQSIEEYMCSRRQHIDKYVEGEHRWYGDTSTALPSLSCYNPMCTPWYVKQSAIAEPSLHREPLPVI
jgi:hypothetical protein